MLIIPHHKNITKAGNYSKNRSISVPRRKAKQPTLAQNLKDRNSEIKSFFRQHVNLQPRDPLLGALWTVLRYEERRIEPPRHYITALLQNWALAITGKWQVPTEVEKALDKVLDELRLDKEELMLQSHETAQQFQQIAYELDLQERDFVRRLIPTGGKDGLLVEPASTDYIARAIWLIITDGDITEIKDALNKYLYFVTAPQAYIPEWYDVRQSVFYPVLQRVANVIQQKLPNPEAPDEEAQEDSDAEDIDG